MKRNEKSKWLSPQDFSELSAKWIASEKAQKKSEHTIKAYDLAIRKLTEYLESNEITEISPLVITDWRTEMFEDGLSGNTVEQYMGAIKRFYEWAKRLKVVDEIPLSSEDIPKHEFKKQSIPTKAEIKKLIDKKPYTLQSLYPLRNYTIVAFLCLTGLRSDEMRSLKVSDLNFDKGYVLVRNGKGGKERKAPFPQKAQKVVREYLGSGFRPSWCNDEDWLFGIGEHEGFRRADKTETNCMTAEQKESEWHKMTPTNLGTMVKRYVKKMIGKDVHPHTLRACAASLWDDADVSMRDVQKALGHSNISTTERIYVHILDDRKSANTINEALEKVEKDEQERMDKLLGLT